MDDRLRRLERAAIEDPTQAPRYALELGRSGDYPAAWATHKAWLAGELGAADATLAVFEAEQTVTYETAIAARTRKPAVEEDLSIMNRLDQSEIPSGIRKMSRVELTSGQPNFQPRDRSWKIPALVARYDDSEAHEADVVEHAGFDDEVWEGTMTVGRRKVRDGDKGVVIWIGESQFGTKVGVKIDTFAQLDAEDTESKRFRKLWGKKAKPAGRAWAKDNAGNVVMERELPPVEERVVFTSIANVDILPRTGDAWMWSTFQKDAQVKEEIRTADIKKGDWVDVANEGTILCGRVFWAGVGKDGIFTLGVQPKGTKNDRDKVRFVPGVGATKLAGPCRCRFKEGRQVATCKSHR